MTALALRDYQAAGIEAVLADWAAGVRRSAVVWPTGAGKTVAFAHLTWKMAEHGGRVLILAHRDELIEQAADKLRMVDPDLSALSIGIYKAGRRELAGRKVVVASVQSLRTPERRAEIARWKPALVIVDECHHAVADTYMDTLRDLGCFDERGTLALGFTATLARSDGLALGEVWEKISHEVGIVDLIRRGFLLDVRGRRVHVDGLDLRTVRRSRGDFQDGALGEAMMECLAPAAAARAYREHAGDRAGIAFWPTVETAYAAAEELEAVGITAACVEGRMSVEDRRLALKRSRAGDIQVLTNCMVLTEGTDLPHVDVGMIARPTLSAPLFVQMAGRILRPYPGQTQALLLDVVGVGSRHRLAGLSTLLGKDRITEVEDDLTDDELEALGLLGLAEIDERDVSGAGSMAPAMVDGVLASHEFELFEQSYRTWLRTDRGVWFISAGEGAASTVIFLVPTPDAPGWYSVAAVPTRSPGGRWVVENVEMTYAMSWGEQEAADLGGYNVRSASWRRGPASEKQLNMLKRLIGVHAWAEHATESRLNTRGQVSDLISIALASARIDHLPMVAGVTR